MKRYPLIALFFITAKGFAQDRPTPQVNIDARYIEVNKKFLSSAGINVNGPVGLWKDFIGIGLGGFYEGRWLSTNFISIYGNAGYTYYSGQSYDGIHQLYFVPGLRVNIVSNFYSYVGVGASYATIDRDDDFGPAFDAGLGIDFIASKKYPLGNTIPVLGLKGGIMSFKYGEDYNTSIGIKLIMTFTYGVPKSNPDSN